MQTVFQNQTTDTTKLLEMNRGNEDTIYIKGTYGTAYLHVEFSPDDGMTWFRDGSGKFSFYNQEYVTNIDVSPDRDTRARIVLEGSDNTTNLTVFFG